VISEVIEGFGGAGYVEDTGSAVAARHAGAADLEGTTNVLSLDALLRSDPHSGLAALLGRISPAPAADGPAACGRGPQAMGAWSARRCGCSRARPDVLQASARRLALTLGRALELALLCEHAQWLLDRAGDRRGLAAALRYSRVPVDLMHEVDPELDRVLLGSGGIQHFGRLTDRPRTVGLWPGLDTRPVARTPSSPCSEAWRT